MSIAVLTRYNNKILYALIGNNHLLELSFFDEDKDRIGTVYLSRISKVIPNIDGGFINYDKDKKGFLKGKDLKSETILPLLLKKEASGEKEPLFTDKISISSEYAVVARQPIGVKASGKISEAKKKKLKDEFSSLANDLGISILLRTNAENASYEDITKDILELSDRLCKLERDSKTRTLYSVLYAPKSEYIKALLSVRRNELTKIVTDDEAIFNEISKESSLMDAFEVSLYNDDSISLLHLYRLEHHISNAKSRIVRLKSGASISIDCTEALTAIDVNTHYSELKGDREETFFNTNVEAAKEIMRQLRIRNISGIIIVDFINMKLQKHYDELLEVLKKLAANDPITVTIHGLTNLMLVEITRKKIRNSLYEQMR